MSVLRIGSTEKYAQGWDLAFRAKPRKENADRRKATTRKKPTRQKTCARVSSRPVRHWPYGAAVPPFFGRVDSDEDSPALLCDVKL